MTLQEEINTKLVKIIPENIAKYYGQTTIRHDENGNIISSAPYFDSKSDQDMKNAINKVYYVLSNLIDETFGRDDISHNMVQSLMMSRDILSTIYENKCVNDFSGYLIDTRKEV